nr:transposase [Robbsia andropogonis]
MGITLETTNTRPSNRRGRPNYTAEYSKQVAVAACQPDTSVAKLTQTHGLNPNMVFKWRRQLRAGLLDAIKPAEALMLSVALSNPLTPEQSEPKTTAHAQMTSTQGSPIAVSAIEIELNGARVPSTTPTSSAMLAKVRLTACLPIQSADAGRSGGPVTGTSRIPRRCTRRGRS